MQKVTKNWLETNASAFTRQASVIVTIERSDGKIPFAGGDRLLSLKHTMNGDMLSGSIPKTEIVFKVDNRSGVFDYDASNQNDVYANARVTAVYGFSDPDSDDYDGISGGIYYVSEVDADDDGHTATFTACDILGFMTDTYKGIGNTNAHTAALDIVQKAAQSQGCPQSLIRLISDVEYMRSINVDFPETDTYTYAEALQLIANACACVLYVDRQSQIHIEKISSEPTDYAVTPLMQYTRPKVRYGERVGNVHVQYAHGKGVGDTNFTGEKLGSDQTVDNPILNDVMQSFAVMNWVYNTLTTGREKLSGTFRADPRVDLFDVITIVGASRTYTVCLTGLSMTFSGAWRGSYQAAAISSTENITCIADLEKMTLHQLETHTLNELEGG